MILLDDELIRKNSYLPHEDLFPVVKSLSRLTTTHSLRLIYLLHKAIEGVDLSSSPLLKVSVPVLSEFLSPPEKSDLPYIIHQSLQEICNTPIHLLRRNSDGRRDWTSQSWLIGYVYHEQDPYVYIHINPSSVRYFSLLSALSVVRPESILALSRTMPIWLYIVLSNASTYSDFWIVPLEDLNRVMMIEARGVYLKWDSNFQHIPKEILGLSMSPENRAEYQLAKLERRPQRFIPMPFSKRQGSLYALRSYSELTANACTIKEMKRLTKIAFSFREEDSNGVVFNDADKFRKNRTFGEVLSNTSIQDKVEFLTTNNLPVW